MKTGLLIVGAAGRMGRRILALAAKDARFDIAAALERPDHPDIGKDAGLVAGTGPLNVNLTSDYPDRVDVAVDFSMPDAAEQTINYCEQKGIAAVLGTTGLDDRQMQKIKAASKHIPIVYATNMSVGMNLLFAFVGKVASMLGDDYDVEIIEQHHRFKKDAPSGSALTLAENICSATGRAFPDSLVHGRKGKDAARQAGTIGLHSVRAGDITGVHSVIFATIGEKLTFTHTAHSRDTFANGALRAAGWVVGKKPGLYSMMDVLGLS